MHNLFTFKATCKWPIVTRPNSQEPHLEIPQKGFKHNIIVYCVEYRRYSRKFIYCCELEETTATMWITRVYAPGLFYNIQRNACLRKYDMYIHNIYVSMYIYVHVYYVCIHIHVLAVHWGVPEEGVQYAHLGNICYCYFGGRIGGTVCRSGEFHLSVHLQTTHIYM